MMNDVWYEMIEMYKCMEDKKCVCIYGEAAVVQNIWCEWYKRSFLKDSDKSEECQILCIRLIGLTSEVYKNCVSYNQYACYNVIQLFKYFSSKDLWSKLVQLIQVSKNKFLVWCVIKSLTVMVHSADESYLCNISILLDDIKQSIFCDETIHIFDFITSLIKYKGMPDRCEINRCVCTNVSSSSFLSSEDVFQSICTILRHHWDSFIQQFYLVCSSSSQASQRLTSFLFLWQNLVQHHDIFEKHGVDHFNMFLNEECVVQFFSYACHLSVISLQIYADIIMQFFIFMITYPSKEKSISSISKSVCDSLNSDFFEMLPHGVQLSSFCSTHQQGYGRSILEDLSKCDAVVAKKISFICLNGLIGTKDKLELWNAIQNIFNFMKTNFDVLSDGPVYLYILNIFMDQDDLLFGMMFALLKLYSTFKEDETVCIPSAAWQTFVENELNPHLIFISFLKQIGFDHNELLSFLTSDETCFLPYLLQYIKLLLKEKDNFVISHDSLICADTAVDLAVTEKSRENLDCISSAGKTLVDYSSSSDEESMPLLSDICKVKLNSLDFKELKAIKTLSQLKESIKKLVDKKEFPYNVSPLLTLLSSCEYSC